MRRFSGGRALALATPLLILALLSVAWFTIAPSAVASATPTISVTGYPGPGETLMVDGGNWPYGDTITITYDGAQLATTVARFRPAIAQPFNGASSGASFKVGAQIPLDTTMGTHIIVATDSQMVTAQTTITVVPEWPQFGFTAANTRYNPYETEIGQDNVANLTPAWSRPLTFPVGGPVVAGGSVYVSTGQAGASYVALDPATGVTRWSLLTPWGVVSSPAVYDGTLYGQYNDRNNPINLFTAYNAANETALWKYSASSGLGVLAPANGMVYVIGSYPNPFGIQPGIGAFNLSGCGQATCAPVWNNTPALGHLSLLAATSDSVYFGSSNGSGCPACGLTSGSHLVVLDAHTGALQWSGNIGDYQDPGTPVVDNGYVIVTANTEGGYPGTPPDPGGTLYVFSAAGCGQAVCQPLWTVNSLTGWGPSVAVANGVIYVGDDDGSLEAFNETGCKAATCSPLWMSPSTTSPISGQTAPSVSSPAVANGVVYFTDVIPNEVMAFKAEGCGATTCSPIWSYPFGARTTVAGSPVVINGTLYVSGYISSASSNGLYAFRLPTTTARRSGASASQATSTPATRQLGPGRSSHSSSPSSRFQAIWAFRVSRYQGG